MSRIPAPRRALLPVKHARALREACFDVELLPLFRTYVCAGLATEPFVHIGDGIGHFDNDTATVDILSAEFSGLTSQQLEAYFEADQAIARGGPLVEEVDMPEHSHTLNFEERFETRRGIEFDGNLAAICLLARDGAGVLQGFLKADMQLSPAAPEYELDELSPWELRTLYLTIDIDVMYVCHRARGVGVGKQLLDVLRTLYAAALDELSEELEDIARATRSCFVVQPCLVAEYSSTAGAGAHACFGDTIERASELFSELQEFLEYRTLEVYRPDMSESF